MKFTSIPLRGAYLIELDRFEDERGFFARSFCQKEFEKYHLSPNFEQCNISFNQLKGTLRGMHYQIDEFSEAKLVRCTMGSIYDVIIDLRPQSETYKKWYAVELTSSKRNMLYIPEHFAHGFQTLENASEVFYQMSKSFVPNSARGIRWNDQAFKIQWPEPNPISISSKDQQYPDYE